jgi:hypothetical protein
VARLMRGWTGGIMNETTMEPAGAASSRVIYVPGCLQRRRGAIETVQHGVRRSGASARSDPEIRKYVGEG